MFYNTYDQQATMTPAYIVGLGKGPAADGEADASQPYANSFNATALSVMIPGAQGVPAVSGPLTITAQLTPDAVKELTTALAAANGSSSLNLQIYYLAADGKSASTFVNLPNTIISQFQQPNSYMSTNGGLNVASVTFTAHSHAASAPSVKREQDDHAVTINFQTWEMSVPTTIQD